MIGEIGLALYGLLLLGFAFVSPVSLTRLVDWILLASYLALCHRHGLAALRGDASVHPFVGTLLLVAPATLLLGSHFVAGPSLRGVVAVVTLASLCLATSLLWRSRRGRRSPLRSFEGWATLAAPFLVTGLLLLLSQGPAGGLMLVFLGWLEYSFRFAGSAVEHLLPFTAAVVAAAFVLTRRVLRYSLPTATLLSLGTAYAIGGYVLFVVYYELPLDHTAADVAAQSHARMLQVEESGHGAGRTLYVDAEETTIYLTVKSTDMFDTSPRKSGILSYDIPTQQETHFHALPAPCITVVVDEQRGVINSCEFFSNKLLQLDLDTLQPTGVELPLPFRGRPEGLSRLDADSDLVRFEIPAGGPDLARVDMRSLELTPMRAPNRLLVVHALALAIDYGRQKIYLPKLGDNRVILNRLDWQGNFEDSVDLEGISFEGYYSPVHDKIFVALLNRNRIYEIDPETFDVTSAEVPNGTRAVRETRDGMLILGDYIRGRLYVYDPVTEQIVETLRVGRKPQAITVAESGNLYVHSSFGFTVFDLNAILADAR